MKTNSTAAEMRPRRQARAFVACSTQAIPMTTPPLGPRLALGARVRVRAWGAVTLTDRGMSDDKLVCSQFPVTPAEQFNVLLFFRFYARCKGVLNFLRARPGRNACDGWHSARYALDRARPRPAEWRRPSIDF
jgi:inorganic pyrophosphatase